MHASGEQAQENQLSQCNPIIALAGGQTQTKKLSSVRLTVTRNRNKFRSTTAKSHAIQRFLATTTTAREVSKHSERFPIAVANVRGWSNMDTLAKIYKLEPQILLICEAFLQDDMPHIIEWYKLVSLRNRKT